MGMPGKIQKVWITAFSSRVTAAWVWRHPIERMRETHLLIRLYTQNGIRFQVTVTSLSECMAHLVSALLLWVSCFFITHPHCQVNPKVMLISIKLYDISLYCLCPNFFWELEEKKTSSWTSNLFGEMIWKGDGCSHGDGALCGKVTNPLTGHGMPTPNN